jgi:predicted RNA methylase
MAITQATKEAIWLRFLLSEILDCLHKKLPSITIFADSQRCIALAHNPKYHARTKHIDIQHHFVREKVDGGEQSLEYAPTSVMVADCLTKALAREKFVQHRASMGIY